MAENEETVVTSPSKPKRKTRLKRNIQRQEENVEAPSITEVCQLPLNPSRLDNSNEEKSISQYISSVTQTSTQSIDSLNQDRTEKLSPIIKKNANKRKKTRRQCPESLPNLLMKDISQLQDDVIEFDGTAIYETRVFEEPTNVHAIPSTGKLFIEARESFKAVDKQTLVNKMETSSQNEIMNEKAPNAMDLCLSLDNRIKCLAKCCCGFLAGIALLQCVLVYQFGPPYFSESDFIQHYSTMAAIIQALYYVLTAVSLFSLCGSLNINGAVCDISLYHVDFGLIALVIYWVCLLLSLSIADKDDAFIFISTNSTVTSVQLLEHDFHVWKNVNLCRCLCATFGWIVLSSIKI